MLIREVAGQGSVLRVDLVDTSGTPHTIWTGTDPSSSSDQPVDFVLSFPVTSYNVASIVVYVNGQNTPALDAVELLTTGSPTSLSLSTQGYDDSGNYNVTVYNSSAQVTSITTYVNGVETQTTSNTYTSGVLSASDVTDVASSAVTHTTYDANGHVTGVTLNYGTGSAATTIYEYSATGLLLQVIDADSNETDYTYNEAGQELSETTPLGMKTMTYNGQDQLVSETNANGLINTYSYDDAGNLTEEVWYESDGTTVVDTLDWSYNSAGQLLSASNSNGTYNYTYNLAGQLIAVSEPFGVSLSFGYDQYGNRNLVEDSFGDVERSLYNANGQLLSRTTVVGSDDLRLDFTYTPNGQIATITRYSDLAGTALVATTTYTYDANGNVTDIKSVNASSTVIDEFDYVYDASGSLSSETDTQSGSPVTTDYGYDSTGQLTSAGSNSYSYDPNGNPLNSGDTVGTDNEISSDGTYNYGYDNEGNETTKTNISTGDYWTYGYNNANELVSAVEKTSANVTELVVDYKYDVFGNRLEQDVTPYTSGTAGTTTGQKYALDGWNAALGASPIGNENWNVWADLNADNTLQTRYVRGDGVDQVFAEVGSSTHWTLTDSQGSVRDVITNSATVVDSISYTAFGKPIETSPGDGGRYLYTGREFDVETGLQYNRARYYDSTMGRWISQDPLQFNAGDSNLYRYVNNAPTNATDPSGLMTATAENEIKGPIEVQSTDKKISAKVWLDASLKATLPDAAGVVGDPVLKKERFVGVWMVFQDADKNVAPPGIAGGVRAWAAFKYYQQSSTTGTYALPEAKLKVWQNEFNKIYLTNKTDYKDFAGLLVPDGDHGAGDTMTLDRSFCIMTIGLSKAKKNQAAMDPLSTFLVKVQIKVTGNSVKVQFTDNEADAKVPENWAQLRGYTTF